MFPGSCLSEYINDYGRMGSNGRWGFLVVSTCRFCRCSIYLCPTPVRSGTTTTPLAVPTSTPVNSICSKCGSLKRSGKRSCCARGGAWFKNCGDAGDTQFDHTWAEGMKACKSRLWRDLFLRCASRGCRAMDVLLPLVYGILIMYVQQRLTSWAQRVKVP